MRLIDADALDKVKFHSLPYTHITPSDADAESYKRGWNDAIDAIMSAASTAQPEPSIPISWIKQHIDWLNSLDNSFSKLTAIQISALVKTWEGEQDE